MGSWRDGYVAEGSYTLGFYRETTTSHLAFAVAALGYDPAPLLRPGKVLELGFGMGMGLVIAAALAPGVTVEGVDFDPQHVVHARGLAAEAGLTNVQLREASFQDIASEPASREPDVDLIVLHGVFGWVSAEARSAIVEIARRRLRPGGYLCLSYNALPGWAASAPLQHLIRLAARRRTGSSHQRIGEAQALLMAMASGEALYVTRNPSVRTLIDEIATANPTYLAHEHLTENWRAFHFSEVAGLLGPAKLTYVGSATLAENIDALSVPDGMRRVVAEADDPVWKETLRDYASNRMFRRDIFVRGPAQLTAVETVETLGRIRFALAVPRDAATLKTKIPLGEFDGKPDVHGRVLDLLATRHASLVEIAALPALSAAGWASALQTVALLVHSGQVLPVARIEEPDRAPARRLNRVMIDRAVRGGRYEYLACPRAGSAVKVSAADMLALAAFLEDPEAGAERMVDRTLASMRRLGAKPLRNGVAAGDQAEERAIVSDDVQTLLDRWLPLWRSLGAL